MREIVTQIAVAVILISLAVELAGWAMQHWLGERWWQWFFGQRAEEPQRESTPLRVYMEPPVNNAN